MESKDKIKKKLQELGISQSKLAEMSGLAFGTINRILNGKQELLPNTLAKIANALNISSDLLHDDDAKEVLESDVQGYIEWDGEIRKIKSFAALQKLVSQIDYETKVLPTEAKAIIAANKRNKANGSNEEKTAIANLLEKREKQAKLDELLRKRDELNKLIDELS